jgi:hypothetical protein
MLSGLVDPVSDALWQWCRGAGVRCDQLVLGDRQTCLRNLGTVRAALRSGDAVVGVGLAGSLLLSLGDRPEAGADARLLALFPYLGVNAYPYDRSAALTAWPERWLRLARLPLLRQALARVALTPAPRGLEGILAVHQLSWRLAASVLPTTDFASLLVAARAPMTVVLNLAAPDLQRERAELVFAALNSALALAFADPADPGLPAQVGNWLQGQAFDSPPESAHA